MQKNHLQKIENELEQLARQHPDVLGENGFTSKVKGKRRRELKDIRNRYYGALLALAELRMCSCSSGATSKKALSPDVMKVLRDVTQGSSKNPTLRS